MRSTLNQMTIGEQLSIIEKLANKETMEELLYLRDQIEHEENDEGVVSYNLVDAFDDAYNAMEGNRKLCGRSYIDNLNEIAIAIGWYVEVSDEELERTISPGKKYELKFKNKKYKFNGKGGL